MVNADALFSAIRAIKLTGAKSQNGRLTQAEVDLVNRTLMGSLAVAQRQSLKVSASGIALIHSFEALRLVSYKDPGSRDGKPITNGWGTTRDEDGGPIPLSVTWAREKADRLFARDLSSIETGVNLLLQDRPATQNQFDALCSLAYNIGLDIDDDTIAEGLGDSTLLKRHLAGDYAGAASEFAKWVFNDGKRMAGLVNRRAAERMMYEGRA